MEFSDEFIKEIETWLEENEDEIGKDDRADIISDYISCKVYANRPITELRTTLVNKIHEENDLGKWADYVVDYLPDRFIEKVEEDSIEILGAIMIDVVTKHITEGKWDTSIVNTIDLFYEESCDEESDTEDEEDTEDVEDSD